LKRYLVVVSSLRSTPNSIHIIGFAAERPSGAKKPTTDRALFSAPFLISFFSNSRLSANPQNKMLHQWMMAP